MTLESGARSPESSDLPVAGENPEGTHGSDGFQGAQARDIRAILLKKRDFDKNSDNKSNGTKQVARDSATHCDVISFLLAEEAFAVRLEDLREIRKALDIIAIPGSNENLRGIVNIRGSLITVLEPKGLLGFGPTEIAKESRILILQHEGRSIGMLVDCVQEILRLDNQCLAPPPEGMSANNSFIKQIARLPDRTIALPDLDALFKIEN